MFMKAVGLIDYKAIDEPDCLMDVTVDKPHATGNQLLVNVKGVSVNPVDVKIRSSKNNKENKPRILGWDACGEVVEVGELCSLFEIGDKVYYAGSILESGSNAEYQLVDERLVAHKPRILNEEESAALPLTSLTAWEGLFERMNLTPYDSELNKKSSLLIIGGAGGVGSMVIQLAKKLGKVGTVIATASREESRQWCLELGADFVIDHSKPLLEQLEALQLKSADYIFCCTETSEYFTQMVNLISPLGSICVIVESKNGTPLNMNPLQAKSVKFCWELMFTRSLFQTFDIKKQHTILTAIADLIDTRVIKTTQRESLGSLNAYNLIKAHKMIESGRSIGKVTLSGI